MSLCAYRFTFCMFLSFRLSKLGLRLHYIKGFLNLNSTVMAVLHIKSFSHDLITKKKLGVFLLLC